MVSLLSGLITLLNEDESIHVFANTLLPEGPQEVS
jgi:hypothetical protein